uniref:mucin-2-like n=1 Tax=Semicossyphus pulcher TaxID=241346 RepID=UPI0037E82C16
MFESADRCCREHDHCPHVIPAFTVNYGVFNSKFFTVSGCDCDQRFRQCLLSVNDTISTMVGYSFFSIMQVPCFELREQKRCTTMSWWGMCKAANVAPYAVYKSPLPYNSSDTPSKYEDNTDSNKMIINVTESPVISTKSPRSEHRCSSREPPRGDTFHRRRKKGKGCKRHKKLSTATPTHLPQKSKADTTTPSICLFNASRSSTFVSNKKRAGKNKGTRKNMSTSATQKSQAHLHVTTNSYPQTSSTQSTPSLTLKPLLQPLVPTVTSAVTKTTKRPKKHGRCCGSRMPLIGDALQSRCKTCQDGKHKRTTHTTTVAPSTTTYVLPIKATICTNLQQKKTKETAKQETLKAPRSRHTSKAPKPAASAHTDGKPQRPIDSQLLSNHTNQESKGRAKTQITPAGGGLTADNHFLCESLKHLDKCKYKIPPLEKRYDLQNKESKTAYHCDCTSRLALQIESFSQPSVLPMLIMDFVSQFCFKLPKEKKCHRKKSCSGGFTKASDLLRALKKIEEKDTAGVRNSVNVRKRGIPVRLSKRCLRLQREAHIMAQLTRL